MKRFALFIIFIFAWQEYAHAQQWLLIEKADDVDTYMRIDCIPESPRNETFFKAFVSPKLAAKWMKEYQYESLPSYEKKSYCFNDEFDHFATRTYDIYDKNDKPVVKSFHGFLTYDSIVGGRAMYFAYWAHRLKTYGKQACIYATETQGNNSEAKWIKFDEDDNMERFIRVDATNNDSLAMYKLIYKAKLAKEIQKSQSFREPPVYIIFVQQWQNGFMEYTRLAESAIGKKSCLTPVMVYPPQEPEKVDEDVTKKYAEWTRLLFEKGQDAIIEKSINLFGKK